MIDRLTRSTLKVISSQFSIVLLFYAGGFLSFIAYYRVLGLANIEGNPQIYAEFAGKNLLIILQTYIYLFTSPELWFALLHSPFWDTKSLWVWVSAFLLLAIMLALLKLSSSALAVRLRSNRWVESVRLSLLFVMMLATLQIEVSPFKVENVLQPANTVQYFQQKKNLTAFENQSQKSDFPRRIAMLNQSNSANQQFFSIPKKYDVSGNDAVRLNALMLIIIIVSVNTLVLAWHRQNTWAKWLLYLYLLVQALFIPFNCGILGAQYQYPLISISYNQSHLAINSTDIANTDKITHKNGVLLLQKSADGLYIYDRLNYFQISYIPQDLVIATHQYATVSPFSNCKNGGYHPCELNYLD